MTEPRFDTRAIVADFFWGEADLIDKSADCIENAGLDVFQAVEYLRLLAIDCRKASDAAAAGRTEILP
jgi:hypothetical protein